MHSLVAKLFASLKPGPANIGRPSGNIAVSY